MVSRRTLHQRKRPFRQSSRRAFFESLESRRLLAVTLFDENAGTLNVQSLDDVAVAITASNDGRVLVNNAPVVYATGDPPAPQAVLANQVVNLRVTGFGDFPNSFDLTGVSPADYAALSSLVVDGGNGTDTVLLGELVVQQGLDVNAEQIRLGGNVRSATAQTYRGSVLLEANTTLQAATGDITFNDEVDATDNGGAGSDYGLTVNTLAGNNIFRGRVGSGSQVGADSDGLRYLRTDDVALPSGQTRLLMGGPISVLTSGNSQTYHDTVLLGANTTLQATTGDITFNDEVDATDNGGAGSDYGLTVNTLAGNNIFRGRVGSGSQVGADSDGLRYLRTDDVALPSGQTRMHMGGPISVLTSGNSQTYHDTVLLGANTTLQATTGDITFNDEVDATDNGGAGSDYGLTVSTLAGNNIFRARGERQPGGSGFRRLALLADR